MARNVVEAAHYCHELEREVEFHGLTGDALVCPKCGSALEPKPITLFEARYPDEGKRKFIEVLFRKEERV